MADSSGYPEEGDTTPATLPHLSVDQYHSKPSQGEVEEYVGDISPLRPYKPRDSELFSYGPAGSDKRSTFETTHLSFGNEGTTATVTEYGQPMQISRYLHDARSSVYMIDHRWTSEPADPTQRNKDLLVMAEYGYGLGADIGSLDVDWSSLELEITTCWLRNRWPRAVVETKDKFSILQQWAVRDGVVIQQQQVSNLLDEEVTAHIILNLDFLIRNEDCVVRNEDPVDNMQAFNLETTDNYASAKGPGGFGFIKLHRLPQEDPKVQCDDAVAVVMGLFIDGKAVELDPEIDRITRTIPKNGNVNLVCGYKLIHLPRDDSNWKHLVLTAKDVDIDHFLLETKNEATIPGGHFHYLFERTFHIERNVEHILSVCMIPVNNEATAMTCGDMSGHRVSISASFFAFKFLINFAVKLHTEHPTRKRIKDQCMSHLRWVFKKAIVTHTAKFVKNYRVNGDTMPESPELLPNGPADTPFQFLKLYTYWKFLDKEIEKVALLDDLLGENDQNLAMRWVNSLDEEDKRGYFAWPHGHRSGIDYFRLDDHVWIWNAINAISEMLNWTQRNISVKKGTGEVPKEGSWEGEWKRLRRTYEPGKVKKEITQRFTIMNDATTQRMLAVTRSSRETRFEFHSRDTALFYNITGQKMLHEDDYRWMNSLGVQRQFPATLEWKETNNPLYYGLNIFMALRELGSTSGSWENELNELKDTLRGSITANGLIPEQLDGPGADESQSLHRDLLLHIPFEVLYLLSDSTHLEHHQLEHQPELSRLLTRTSSKLTDEAGDTLRRLDGTVPFNDQIDERSIINLKEEWLYNYPSFLGFKPLDYDELDASSRFWNPNLWASPSQLNGNEHPDQAPKPIFPEKKTFHHLIMEVGKKSKAKGEHDGHVYRSSDINKSWDRLQKLRDEQTAKKRLLWFQNAPTDLEAMCRHIASPTEKQPVQLFFERHTNYTVLVEDKTNRATNLWETEFHCSFLQIVSSDEARRVPDLSGEGISSPESPEFPKFALRRAKLGFRIHGDFFDRFWTCHFVEEYPGDPPEQSIERFFSSKNVNLKDLFSGGRKHVWQQRKVLEPILFYHIITQLNKSTRGIIKGVKDRIQKHKGTQETPNENIGKEQNPFAHFDPSRYFKSLKEWAYLHEVLEILSGELLILSENVKNWETREENRGTEQPRWTNKDERKYRDAINKALQLSHAAGRELNSERTKVSSLLKDLQYVREEAKNTYDNQIAERSFQQNNNVKFFTYATVIFQPLAFAASIYSMQSAPPNDVLQHMVILSVVGFAILLILVLSLPHLTNLISSGLEKGFKPSNGDHAEMKANTRSVNLPSLQSFWKKDSSRFENPGDEESGRQRTTTRTSSLGHSLV